MECKCCGYQMTEKLSFCPMCGEPVSEQEWEEAQRAEELVRKKREEEEKAAHGGRTGQIMEAGPGVQNTQGGLNDQIRKNSRGGQNAQTGRNMQGGLNGQIRKNRRGRQNVPNGQNGDNKKWVMIVAGLAALVLILSVLVIIKTLKNGKTSTAENVTVEEAAGNNGGTEAADQQESAAGTAGNTIQVLPGDSSNTDAAEESSASVPESPGIAEGLPDSGQNTQSGSGQNTAGGTSQLPPIVTIAPTEEMITVIGGIEAPASDFVFPHSSTQLLGDADFTYLRSLSEKEYHFQTQLGINEIYARYGYTFNGISETSKDAIAHFADKEWYKKAQALNPTNDNALLRANYFNSIEKQNINTLLDWQKSDHYKEDGSGSGYTGGSSGSSSSGSSSSSSGETITIIGGIEAPASDFVFPYSSTQLLTDSELNYLKNLDAKNLHFQAQLAISEIFARYGYTFVNQNDVADNARAHFVGKDWYTKAQAQNPTNDQSDLMTQYFNDIEKANVQTLLDFQNTYDHYRG